MTGQLSTSFTDRAAGELKPAGAAAGTRLESVDVVRGVIMIIMALDHTRDFFGVPGQNPTNLAQASAALFLTRWITHFCAPVFFLLTGTGAYLSLGRKSARELSRFLFTRGLWLIVVELVLARCLVYQFNVDYRVTMLLVLWALGWSMIALSALTRLPAAGVTAVGVLMILGHNLFDAVQTSSPLWSILHVPGVVLNNQGHIVFVSYPLIPWIGVTAAGYGLGQVFAWGARERRSFLLRVGTALCLAFVVVRGFNGYGDPSHWSGRQTVSVMALSFLNATKYPPSLVFLLMTLGPALLLLWAFDRGTPRFVRPALVLGRVPLFYYLLHFFLIHLLAVATCYVRYGTAYWMFESASLANYPITAPPGWGYPLPVVYGVWILVVAAGYPACAAFAALKKRRAAWWLSYV